MTLAEKIYDCRKKSGRSQEALAEALGVSRQAVSKWETGDAEPELSKLRLLAAEFGVSVDWLLSEEAPPEEPQPEPDPAPEEARPSAAVEVMDAIPGFLGRMLKKFGWLYGVYVAIAGVGMTLIGGLARYLSRSMMSGVENAFNQTMSGPVPGSITLYDAAGNLITDQNLIDQFAQAAGIGSQTAPGVTVTVHNPVATFGGVIMVVGIVLMLAGVGLAIWLRKKSKQ